MFYKKVYALFEPGGSWEDISYSTNVANPRR